MIARTVTPGDSTGGIAKTGEARAHRQTRRGRPARIATAADGDSC
jgi:hypothetical protein